jgi:tetratricopeptide (TPR) repeat protein
MTHQSYFNLGITLREIKIETMPLKILRKAIEIDPNNGESYFHLGETLLSS